MNQTTINQLSMRLALIDQSETYHTIVSALIARQKIGIEKYGHTVDRTDMIYSDWIREGTEELLDALMYFARAQRWDIIEPIYTILKGIMHEETRHTTTTPRN